MGRVRPRNRAAAAPRRGGGGRATRCGAVTEVQSRSTKRALRQNLATDAAVVGARRASDGAGREASSYGAGARHVNVFFDFGDLQPYYYHRPRQRLKPCQISRPIL